METHVNYVYMSYFTQLMPCQVIISQVERSQGNKSGQTIYTFNLKTNRTFVVYNYIVFRIYTDSSLQNWEGFMLKLLYSRLILPDKPSNSQGVEPSNPSTNSTGSHHASGQ